MKRRRLTERDRENLAKSLSVPCVPDCKALKIWNIARKGLDASTASDKDLKTTSAKRLADPLECFQQVRLVGTEVGEEENILIPKIPELLNLMTQKSEAWRCALEMACDLRDGTLTPIYYHDEVVCGNILAVIKKKEVDSGIPRVSGNALSSA